jgi:hypothetical protein
MKPLRIALATTLSASLALTTACAGLEATTSPPGATRILDERLMVGNMAARNSFELRNQAPEPRPAEPRADVTTSSSSRRPVTPILFWLGIGMAAVGGVGLVSTGAAGYATQRQISNGYHSNIDSAETRTLEARGAALNKVTIASAVVTIVGAVLAITTYGYDYTHCGPLAPKKRRDAAPPGRCQAADNK